MSDIIEVKNISKAYTLYKKGPRYKSLRDDIAGILQQPLELFKEEREEKFWALKKVSFTVKKGESIGIIGPNGAGKTTLLKILSRITNPTSGEIILRGRLSSLLEVGTGFHPELTGRENVYLNGAILGMTKSEIKKKFNQIVEFAEIEKFLDTPVKHYSSGMYVRLAFSIAAHLEPEILLVDEVLAVGDIRFQKKCLGKMSEIGKVGRTILFVSHNMSAIQALCQKVILLKNGKMMDFDISNKVINRYISEIGKYSYVKEWKRENLAPHNTSIVLKKVKLCSSEGKVLRVVSTDDPFNVEITFTVTKPQASIGLNVIFYDRNYNCVCGSINNHEKNWYGKMMPKGIYKSICKVPAHFFNNGIFSIRIYMFGPNYTDDKMSEEILRFEILDGAYVRGDYFGAYDGVVRPLFEWETVRV